MKTKHFLGLAIVCFILTGCTFIDDIDDRKVICQTENPVFAFTVDYTGNEFLGGYLVTLPSDSLNPVCDYASPGDFGHIVWYNKNTETKLFAGTIVWAGKGQRTYPEKITSPSAFEKLDKPAQMPKFQPLYHDAYDKYNREEVDYQSIWNAIKYLEYVSWVSETTVAYIYLYQPSVGAGDPKDWYWIIFLKY